METRKKIISVRHPSDGALSRSQAKAMAEEIGFEGRLSDEIALAVSELASNLVRHAGGGSLVLTPLAEMGRVGIQIESLDTGPGFDDFEQAVADGFSTSGGPGYGLGTVNRIMDFFELSHQGRGQTRLVGRRWLRSQERQTESCPLDIGAATRPHPRMKVNGDAFIIKKWDKSALAGVIDGLGHGQFAHRAAQRALQFVENHFDQPLEEIFRGTARTCRSTRGVVMALVRFDLASSKMTFTSVGNVGARILDSSEPRHFLVRRGILGSNAPSPMVTEHRWTSNNIMVLFSDGLTSHWRWEDFPRLRVESASEAARRLLHTLAKDNDDATVVVIKGKDERDKGC